MISFHKEGYNIIVVSLLLSVAGVLLAEKFIEIAWMVKSIQVLILGFLIIILQFFRNPKRNTVLNEKHIIAPVDGKVVVIEEVEETEYFKDKSLNLTEKESDLILFINSSKRAELKKIQKIVWGYSSNLETHTVETHIYRLRKKMLKNFKDHNFIKHDQYGYYLN